MSDDDRDIEIESDEENDSDNTRLQVRHTNNQTSSQADKRAHHNALERKRRDHIKDSFTSLRDAVPSLQGEKASRAQILKKAADYIQHMRRKNQAHQQDIEDLKRQNNSLELQIRQLEKAKEAFALGDSADMNIKCEPSDSSDGDDHEVIGRRTKKLKTTYMS